MIEKKFCLSLVFYWISALERKQGELLEASPLKGFGESIPYFFLPELRPFFYDGESGETEFSLFLKLIKTVGTAS